MGVQEETVEETKDEDANVKKKKILRQQKKKILVKKEPKKNKMLKKQMRKLKLKTLKLPLLLKKIRGRKLQKKLNTLHVFNFPSTNKKHTHTPKQKTTILFLLRDK